MESSIELKIKELEKRIISIGADVEIIKHQIVEKNEKKDPKAWHNIEKLGREISKNWQSKKASWQIISENRR